MPKDKDVYGYVQRNGCDCRFVRVEHVQELKEQIESLLAKGLVDRGYYEYCLGSLNYSRPRNLPEAKSLAIVAVPVPAGRISFSWKGKKVETLVPPTYFGYRRAFNLALRLLRESTAPGKFRFVKRPLPYKTLAVRSGLALYGRNNITYHPKFGSFMRLVGFFTDYRCETDSWQEAKALPLCGTCRACVNACPTGAIGNDRFLLRAERCIAYHNEMPSSKSSFPLWIPPESHNSIVGCMLCQRVCPMDREVISWAEDLCAFTEEETGCLLGGRYDGDERLKIEKKLRKAGLDLSIFPRNLEAILR